MPQPATQTQTNGAIAREFLAHYINATPKEATAKYVRIGKDLEEYDIILMLKCQRRKTS